MSAFLTTQYKGCYINSRADSKECTIVWPDHTIKIAASFDTAKGIIRKAVNDGKVPEAREKPVTIHDLPVIVVGEIGRAHV